MAADKQHLVAQKFEQKARTGDVLIREKTTFAGLMLAPEVLEGLHGAGFAVPSPIQLQAIPLGRAGLDLIVQAKSGTGKTCVFTVIALESIDTESSCLQVVILAPTREIAVQIWEVIKSIGCAMPKLRCYVFIGGLNVSDDRLKLKKCHIAVATPGRFRQLIELDAANVNSVRLFVLDEADKLLEAGFQEDINWIYSSLPANKQMIAASATYPEYLAQQLTTYMRSPKMIRLNACDPALLGISQYYVVLPFSSLPYKVFEEKSDFLLRLLSSIDFQQCLVFSNYQSRAQSLSKLLTSKGWQSTYICGSQEQEKRLTAMAKLRQYQCRILISTDLTSRGIDVENVNLVVNLDLPVDYDTYLHRIGRAGRFGSFGAAVTLVTQGREAADLRVIETRCQTSIQLLPDPIPEGLARSSAKVDLNTEVMVEEAVNFKPSPVSLPFKMWHETENALVYDAADANLSRLSEREFHFNHTTEHKGSSVVSSAMESIIPSGSHIEAQDTRGTVNDLQKDDNQLVLPSEGEDKGSEGFAVSAGIELPQQEQHDVFLLCENNDAETDAESVNACKNEIDALNENAIDSLKATDVVANKSDAMPEKDYVAATNGANIDVMEVIVENSNKQLDASDSISTETQPRGNCIKVNDNKSNSNWHSFVKEIPPVSEQILSLNDLVYIQKSYVAETDGAGEASGGGSNPVEDVAIPNDESVFDDIRRLITDSNYNYAAQFPCSAKLLGDILVTEGDGSTVQTKVILSGGDSVSRNLAAEQHLPNVERNVVQLGGDDTPPNLSEEDNLPDKESEAKETTVKEKQTSELHLVPKCINNLSGTVYQDTKPFRRITWTREQLLSMEKLSHNVVISPQVLKLVQEMCIRNSSECSTHEARDRVKSGNARGRPRAKPAGNNKPKYTSNWKEPLPASNIVSNVDVEATASSPPISLGSTTPTSSSNIVEHATPSLLTNDSVDTEFTAALNSSRSIIVASTQNLPVYTTYIRSTATPSFSYVTMEPASPAVGCIDTRSTATLTSSLQKTSGKSSMTYSSQRYQVSEQVENHHSAVAKAEIKSPSIHLQGNQTLTTVSDELLNDALTSPSSETRIASEVCDKQLQSAVCSSSESNVDDRSTEPELCSSVVLVPQPENEKREVIQGDDTILSWQASSELICSLDTEESICENRFQEIPVPACDGKFSELPYEGSTSPFPPLEPQQQHIQVVDDQQHSLGREYMLKLSACKDVTESSSESFYGTENDLQDDLAEGVLDGLYWKPSAKQTSKKNRAEKKTQTSIRSKEPVKKTIQATKHQQKRRTHRGQNTARKEPGSSHDIASTRKVHDSHDSSDEVDPEQPFPSWTYQDADSRRDGAHTRKVRDGHRTREPVNNEHSIPWQPFPGSVNLDAYSSYCWNSYMAHLQNAEYFGQLITALADHTRLQNTAAQQVAYIQHMIAFHRTL